jgi:hypothetical protein
MPNAARGQAFPTPFIATAVSGRASREAHPALGDRIGSGSRVAADYLQEVVTSPIALR